MLNRPMNKVEFERWLRQWSQDWNVAKSKGEPDFGKEKTLQDWLGSLDAYARLQEISVLPEK